MRSLSLHTLSLFLIMLLNTPDLWSGVEFAAPIEFEVESPQSIAIGDFDDDGNLDIAVASTANDSVSVLFGDGEGDFEEPEEHAVGDYPYFIATADLDNDGALDLVVTNFFGGSFSVLLGDGDGDFGESEEYECGSVPTSVAIADYDEDGSLDIVVANHDESTLTLHLGEGDGSFEDGVPAVVPNFPAFVLAIDLDEDGHMDLLSSNSLESTFTVLMGNGDALFPEVTTIELGADDSVWELGKGDLDGDGNIDVIVPCSGNDAVGVFLGNGDGTLQDGLMFEVGELPMRVDIAGFQSDNDLDIVCLNYATQDISVCLNDGAGDFIGGDEIETLSNLTDIASGDFNGDGKLDLVVASDIGDTIELHLNTTPDPLFKRGDVGLSGVVSIEDAVQLVQHLFLAGETPLSCPDAADGDDNGALTIADILVVLNYLFVEAADAPAAPGPDDCGIDETDDDLEACSAGDDACL